MSTMNRIRRVRPAGVEARVTSIGLPVQRADTSRQMSPEDEFNASAIGKIVITPPYSPHHLLRIVERSNMLGPCVEAMVTNVASSGWEVVPVSESIPVKEEERETLQSFIDSANSEESLIAVNSKITREYESVGYGFLEVIRDLTGHVSVLRHAKASITRLLPRHEEPVKVVYDIKRGPRTSFVTEFRRFRRYVQIVQGKTVYFKEFGDPRRLNYETGNFDSEGTVPTDKEATELIHFRQDSEDPYGVPRWISQLPSILGSREAEEVNLRYFEDNTVPPMLLTVSGGRLTASSFRELQKMLQRQGVGKDRQHQIMLVEAVPETSGIDDKGANVSLDVHKLTDVRQSDGLFKDYDESNRAKVRSSFRLPPVTVGASQDVTFATANVSAFLAETQVFAPQRRATDEIYNKRLVNHPRGLNLKTVMLKSKVPAITNPEMTIKTLTALNVMGGVTPRSAITAANKVLQTALPQYPEQGEEGWEPWMDRPIAFSLKGSSAGGETPDNTQTEQSVKDQSIKDVEEDGDIAMKAPENGQQ